jgi:hypothetical protein
MSGHIENRRGAAAFAAWLALQLIALGICTYRVRFWARAPSTVEQSALVVMLALQIATSSMLFPYLLSSVRLAILSLVTAWPLGQLAAYLSDTTLGALVCGESYVCVWLAALFLWTRTLRNDASRRLAAAIATLFCLGGPVLFYLRMDFGNEPQFIPDHGIAAFGPVMGAVSQTFPDRPIVAWITPTLFLIATALIRWQTRAQKQSSRHIIH